jgi:four helix bundle protein
MGKVTKRFEELDIWKLARKFAKEVWYLSIDGNFSKDYKLKDQINASAGSTMDNIAEGHDRGGIKSLFIF